MTLILDIILVGVFAALVIAAAKKGFILTVLEVVAIIAALMCASYLSKPIAQGAYDTFLKNSIIKAIDSEVDDKTVSSNINEIAFKTIPEYAIGFAECAGINMDAVKNDINNTVSGAISAGVPSEIGERIEENCVRPVAVPAIGIIMFFIMFAILLVVFRLLAKGISESLKLPLVDSLNTVLGGVIGAVRGAVVLLVISTVLVTMLSNGDSDFAIAIRESKVIEIVNGFNPFAEKLQNLFVK